MAGFGFVCAVNHAQQSGFSRSGRTGQNGGVSRIKPVGKAVEHRHSGALLVMKYKLLFNILQIQDPGWGVWGVGHGGVL
jgi:hypothetical protein